MDWTNWQDIGILLLLVAFFVVAVVFNKRRNNAAPMVVAVNLYRDIEKNQKLINAFSYQAKARTFKVKNWQKNRNRMDFLSEELRSDINAGFTLVEDFNRQIDAARKAGSVSYPVGVQVDKLKEPFTRAREGLVKWIQDNWGNRAYLPKRIGFFN